MSLCCARLVAAKIEDDDVEEVCVKKRKLIMMTRKKLHISCRMKNVEIVDTGSTVYYARPHTLQCINKKYFVIQAAILCNVIVIF